MATNDGEDPIPQSPDEHDPRSVEAEDAVSSPAYVLGLLTDEDVDWIVSQGEHRPPRDRRVRRPGGCSDTVADARPGGEMLAYSSPPAPPDERRQPGDIVGVIGVIDGGASPWTVEALAPTEVLELSGPTLWSKLGLDLGFDRPERHEQLRLAGGIGITPFLAMAQEMTRHPDAYADYDVILVVGVDYAGQAFKLAELREYQQAHPGFTVHLWDRSVRGLPTAEAIRDTLALDIAERTIGPPGRWELASPALQDTRYAATAFFAIFVLAVIVSTVSRAVAG